MPTAFAIAAHPDDIEFVMAGTLIRLRDNGWTIHYMNIADGCCGSSVTDAAETARIRAAEARRAAESIGAVFHSSICPDLGIFYDDATLRRLAAVVREVSPSIVLTHAPIDYMEDHTNTCRLAVTAAFARGMPNYATHPPRPAIDAPVTLYHAQPHGNRTPLGELVTPTHFVDVGGVMAEKIRMLEHHRSQKEWLDRSQGMDSYVETMKSLMREAGSMSGAVEYAEGWRRRHHLGFCAADADPLASLCIVPGIEPPGQLRTSKNSS
ncbi:MAG: PIG-L family deacetylase [Planctomycetota bacterium]